MTIVRIPASHEMENSDSSMNRGHMRQNHHRRQTGITLVELLLVVVIAAVMAAIAIPSYSKYLTRAKNSQAMKDIAELALAIDRYYTKNSTYPATLADLDGSLPTTDPWGNAYGYLPIDIDPPPVPGAIRRDKDMNPLNSDYDLYSKGPDGETQKALTAAKAKDDIVRAGNGGFIGLASEH